MLIPVKTSVGSYSIVLDRGAINELKKYMDLNRRVLIVTDSGVPYTYAETVAKQCENAVIKVIEQGEASKNLNTYSELLETLVDEGFTRSDCVVAVGGGVVGDLSGFVAASFMRGIDFYNIPTTVLSQVDSSVGGKTAIDFKGIKNIVGAFYPPKCVIIDPDTLKTLPERQISNGLAEAVKMALTSDGELFSIFENEDIYQNIDLIIERSVKIKRSVVEEDEKENGLRRILNFGHTLAHAIESVNGMSVYYHGECVAIGMLPMCSENVRKRLIPVLEKLKLPTFAECDGDEIITAARHDKKMSGESITVVLVPEIGKFELKKLSFGEIENCLREAVSK